MTVSKRRPSIVTTIALVQFARSGFLFAFIAAMKMYPTLHLDTYLDIKVLVYIAASQNVSSSLLIISALFIAAVGIGLWTLHSWARIVLMVTSGGTAALWIRRLIFDRILGDPTLGTEAARQTIYAVILIDSLIFCCLAIYPDVKMAFGKDE